MDIALRLWQDFRRWTTGADKRPFHDETVCSLLRLIEALVLPHGTGRAFSAASPKTAHGLVSCILSLLDRPSLSASSQTQLASVVIRLRSAYEDSLARTSPSARRRAETIGLIAEGLNGGIAIVCQDEEKFAALHKDLQVCLRWRS